MKVHSENTKPIVVKC